MHSEKETKVIVNHAWTWSAMNTNHDLHNGDIEWKKTSLTLMRKENICKYFIQKKTSFC